MAWRRAITGAHGPAFRPLPLEPIAARSGPSGPHPAATAVAPAQQRPATPPPPPPAADAPEAAEEGPGSQPTPESPVCAQPARTRLLSQALYSAAHVVQGLKQADRG
jgi:hypothetical protein